MRAKVRWPFWAAMTVALFALGIYADAGAMMAGFAAAVTFGWMLMALPRLRPPVATTAPVVYWVSGEYSAAGKEPVN